MFHTGFVHAYSAPRLANLEFRAPSRHISQWPISKAFTDVALRCVGCHHHLSRARLASER